MFGYNLRRMMIRVDNFISAAADTWYRLLAAYDLEEIMKKTGQNMVRRIAISAY